MVLMSVSNDEAGDFRSKPRWSANRKIEVLRVEVGWPFDARSGDVAMPGVRRSARAAKFDTLRNP